MENKKVKRDEIYNDENWELVKPLLVQLTPREERIIKDRKNYLTYEEIGASVGTTRERIRQIESKAIYKLTLWISREKEQIEKQDNTQEDIENIKNEIMKQYKRKQEQAIVDDIAKILKGDYSTYDEYIQEKKKLVDQIHQLKEESQYHSGSKFFLKTYIEPTILSENIFNYVKEMEEKDAINYTISEALQTIRILKCKLVLKIDNSKGFATDDEMATVMKVLYGREH